MIALIGCNWGGKENMAGTNDLSIVVSSDKNEYKLGDVINIKYSFINNSAESVTFLPWGKQYAINWILLYDSKGGKVKAVKTMIFELKTVPDKNDFVTLNSGQHTDYDFAGKVVKGELKYLGSTQKYSGLFINFANSAYLLDGGGGYAIKGIYNIKQNWIEAATKLLIKNIYNKDIESNEIKIIIQE